MHIASGLSLAPSAIRCFRGLARPTAYTAVHLPCCRRPRRTWRRAARSDRRGTARSPVQGILRRGRPPGVRRRGCPAAGAPAFWAPRPASAAAAPRPRPPRPGGPLLARFHMPDRSGLPSAVRGVGASNLIMKSGTCIRCDRRRQPVHGGPGAFRAHPASGVAGAEPAPAIRRRSGRCGGVSANPGRGTPANPGVPSGAITNVKGGSDLRCSSTSRSTIPGTTAWPWRGPWRSCRRIRT